MMEDLCKGEPTTEGWYSAPWDSGGDSPKNTRKSKQSYRRRLSRCFFVFFSIPKPSPRASLVLASARWETLKSGLSFDIHRRGELFLGL